MDRGQCLTEETLTEYLEGALDPVVTAACEVHLIACDRCREELALYMRVMQRAVTDDENAKIDRIWGSWDRREPLPPVRKHGGFANRRVWFLSLVSVAAVAVFGVLFLWNSTRRPVEPQSGGEIVQLLLAQGRPFELRLNEQAYQPIVRTRGAEDPGVDYGLIAGEMTRLSADSYAMGRFYLLQKDFDQATAQLEDAERQPGVSAAVHNDLGVAYMERGGETNLRKAAEEFRHAQEMDPNFAPAVFNLAIFHERTGTLSQAETQWRRYLQLDPNSGWAGEVRSKLENVSR
jgi:tetratricopeptide (TPR) repeat protein